ncbi:MAG: sigma-70 family RNA polymerase sigma factor [Acidimicrobiales bacterium]
MAMRRDSEGLGGRTDAELVALAAGGEQSAFGELYRRHVEPARAAARGVADNDHDAADAVSDAFANVFRIVRAGRFPEGAEFQPYVVTSARRAAIDQLRRAARTVTGGHELDERGVLSSMVARPSERVVAVESAELVSRAFAGMPSHLRAVLQLTELDGMPLREAAAVLGVSPNTAAQRAVRARARLRQRYLQAHVAPWAEEKCRPTVDQLGAYVSDGLSPRDVRKVEAHLERCETCRHRVVELREIGAVLRRAVLRRPLDVAATPPSR